MKYLCYGHESKEKYTFYADYHTEEYVTGLGIFCERCMTELLVDYGKKEEWDKSDIKDSTSVQLPTEFLD